MKFKLNNEQVELRVAVRRLLENRSGSAQVRQAVETPDGYDRALWMQMATELGLHGIAVPEEYGGSGAGFVELAIVLEELGRALAPGPFFSTVVLATRALLGTGDEQACKTWLPGIVDGQVVGTLAMLGPDGDWEMSHQSTTATRSGQGWTLAGTKAYVTDGAAADLIVVLASTDEGPTLFAVRGDAPGLSAIDEDVLDQTRRMATLTFESTPAEILGELGGGRQVVDSVVDAAAVALSCEMVGAANRCLEMSTEYAKNRRQFGRPIGSFQAIKHLLAERFMDNESSLAAVYYAAWAVDNAPEEVPMLARLTKAFVSDAFFSAAAANIQVHGGVGFTWEHDAHLFFKRATVCKPFLGSPEWHRERLAAAILEGAAPKHAGSSGT